MDVDQVSIPPPPPTEPRRSWLKTVGIYVAVWFVVSAVIAIPLGVLAAFTSSTVEESNNLSSVAGIIGLIVAYFAARRYWRTGSLRKPEQLKK
jgi:hypothetical protein